MKSPRRAFTGLLMLLTLGATLFSLVGDIPPVARGRPAAYPGGEPFVSGLSTATDAQPSNEPARGPFYIPGPSPYVFNGDLRDLPQLSGSSLPRLEMPRPGTVEGAKPTAGTADLVAQTQQGAGQMPQPIANFEGLNIGDGGGWRPPDTNGDVGPDYYLQGVNIALGIYDKDTGEELVAISFDELFNGTGTPCDNYNRGDIVVLYDPLADRWLVTDFSLPTGGPFYECIALSQSGDPIGGGWYFWGFEAGPPGGPWNDYPKLGVWPDAYYMAANMFEPWSGAWVWALDRASMLSGGPANAVRFEPGVSYASLLPSNVRGAPPPAGAPNYFASIDAPNTLRLWEFHVDWANPGNSTFTGPVNLTVADFDYAPWNWIPQAGTTQLLDSLGDRLMFSLFYRNMGDYESLWVNHTINSNNVAGVRWYEVRDPGGAPVVYQQGTYRPDENFRWMGSIAADRDGNAALGYSVSSEDMYPAIRYAGRLYGEPLGTLPQAETSLIEGHGAQTSNRWGDYSMMTVDPVDDCTFWYTQEYLQSTGGTWLTRIGAFRFPSCGRPKGWISGTVYDAFTLAPLEGVTVVAAGEGITFTALSDAGGAYVMILPGGAFTLTAGPLPPGYPDPAVAAGVNVTAGATTTQDLALTPKPYLAVDDFAVDDDVPGGNGNGYVEPGETGLLFWETLRNTGAITATNVAAHLVARTPGVRVSVADAAYPDIAVGQAATNLTAFEFSVAPTVPCGAFLDFATLVVANEGAYTVPLRFHAGIPGPRAAFFTDNMESGPGNWTPGGYPQSWQITTEQAHSPSHAWSDSPYGNYVDNANTWLRAPFFNLTGLTGFQLTFWHRYALETGYDYSYVEYSTDGGADWDPFPVSYNGFQYAFVQETLGAALFDDQPNVSFRFRLVSDGGVTEDGWYIDDVALTYQPYGCVYPTQPPAVPVLVSPPDGAITGAPTVTLTWQPGSSVVVDRYNLDFDGTVYTTTDTFSATVLSVGVHTWTVRACNIVGCSGYAAPWTIERIAAPAVPELLAPPDGALITTTHDVTLTWQAGAGYAPAAYDLELDGVTQTVTATAYPVTLPAGAHSWRVRACNLAGCSDYTAAWGFDIIDAPAAPVLLSPPDGTVTTTAAITLTWQPSTTGGLPDGYDVEVDGAVYTATTTTLRLTLGFGDHAWRVRACNLAGCSDYTAAWTVTIVAPAGVPVLLAPPDGTVTTTTTLTFTWQAGPGGAPDGYNLELDGVVVTTTTPLYAATLAVGEHTWRVRAFNAAGYTDYTAAWTVTVQEAAVTYRVFLPLAIK